MAELIEMRFGLWLQRAQRTIYVLDGDPDPPWEGEIFFWGGEGLPIVKYMDALP